MPTPNKHAAIIKAWADGHAVQFRTPSGINDEWRDTRHPSWHADFAYRVKPELKTPGQIMEEVFTGRPSDPARPGAWNYYAQEFLKRMKEQNAD